MALKGPVLFLLLLISISSGQEKRSLFDDLIPTTKLTKRHFEIEGTPQQRLCDGRMSSQPCSNSEITLGAKGNSSPSSLFDQSPKTSEPIKGKENSHQPSSSPPKTSSDVAKYVPAPYHAQNSSQSLFDEYMTIEAPSKPALRNSRPSSTIGWQDFASKTRSPYSSSSASEKQEELAAKTGGSSSLGRDGVSKSRGSIMEKEKEALENLSNYVWKEALQNSQFERDSSKDDLNLIANSAQKLKHMMDGDFQSDDTDSTKLSSKPIDRSFSDSGDRRKLSNQDLRSLAKLLNKSSNHVSEDSFPETNQSFVPFLDEIKANRLKDLRLALKLMKSIQRAKDHRYAGNTRSEDFELNLAQLLFDSNIQSLRDLTRTQRNSLDVLMKRMENTLQTSSESSENRSSLYQLLDESDSDFNVGFFRPPTSQSDPSRAYETPPQPSGLYGTPTATRRPQVRPPPTATSSPRPPSPRPTVPTTPRPVGPPAPPPVVIRPVGPPSVGPPAIRPSQIPPFSSHFEEPLFISSDLDDEDDSFFLAPSQDEALDVTSFDDEYVWTPLNPAAPHSTYGAPTEARGPPSSVIASNQATQNYHYHYHTLAVNNQNRRDFKARPKPTRLTSSAARNAGRIRRPLRLPLAPPRRPSTSSYSSLESLPLGPSLPAASQIAFPPENPSAYVPPQSAPPVPSYAAPPRDPVPTYEPPQAEPAPIYVAPRDPPAPPPIRYGPLPADPPAPAYGPPPRDPAPTYGPPPADPPPMTYGPPPPRDPEPPSRTQTRVVFLSPVKEKKKEKFWKKGNRGGNFNAFSVLFDEETGLSRQSDSFQQSRDSSRDSLRDDYSNRRDDLRDQFWRNRERLFRQQQEAFDLQRLRLEIDLQERQRSEMKKNLFRNLLRDERDTGVGGITSMFYKGVQALGAMALMPITNLIGRKKRDLESQPMPNALFYSGDVKFESFPLNLQNSHLPQEKNPLKSISIKNGSNDGPKKKYIPKSLTNLKHIKYINIS